MQIILKENGIEKKAKVESLDFTGTVPVLAVLTGEELEIQEKRDAERFAESIGDIAAEMRASPLPPFPW